MSRDNEALACGSPPRVWGQLPGGLSRHGHGRFTPTRVGTTSQRPGRLQGHAVHPHACGDNRICGSKSLMDSGSPPRVWGQLHHIADGDCHHGSPPRVWGQLHHIADGDCHHGSPPRVWGQQERAGRAVLTQRFTPTRVGTTDTVTAPLAAEPVHPHACGDNRLSNPLPMLVAGSPPRVWGQLDSNGHEIAHGRFTPTRVGTTAWRACVPGLSAVHPHACGDNVSAEPAELARGGSPPRVWGQPIHNKRFDL